MTDEAKPAFEKTSKWLVKMDLTQILSEVLAAKTVRGQFTWHPGIKGSNGHALDIPEVKELLIFGLQQRIDQLNIEIATPDSVFQDFFEKCSVRE